MIGKHKKFNKALYNENDNAKLKAIEFFERMDIPARVNPDQYGIDLIVGDSLLCEVEVKKVWSGKNFQYPTLQIPERKMKFANSDTPMIFMVMNKERTHAFIAKQNIVAESPIVVVPNKYVANDERFFQVPVEKLIMIEL